MDSMLRSEIHRQFDFGGKVFDPEQFEADLLKKFNKVELRKVVKVKTSEDDHVEELPPKIST